MSPPFEYLDTGDLIDLATRLLGDPPPIRDVGLLASAAARPRATVFGEDAYSDVWAKAAALMQSIVKNHALVDGNKRLAWLATAVFLEINGVDTTGIADGDVVAFVIEAAAGDHEISELAERTRELCAPKRRRRERG